jgi:hypothetical protein
MFLVLVGGFVMDARERQTRERLMKALTEFIHMQLYPTPYGLRCVAQALLELREIMLTLDKALLEDAIQQIEFWIENTKRGNSYELYEALRELKQAYMRSLQPEEPTPTHTDEGALIVPSVGEELPF